MRVSGFQVSTVDREMFAVEKFSPIEQMAKIKHAKNFLPRIFRAMNFFLQRILILEQLYLHTYWSACESCEDVSAALFEACRRST